MISNYEFWLRQGDISFRFPFLPAKLNVSNTSQNTVLNVEDLGDVTIFRASNLLVFTFNSQLPAEYFLGCEYNDLPNPQEAWLMLNALKNSEAPVRFIVTGTPINLEVSIETLTAEDRGGDVGTIYYNLKLKEYRKGAAKQVRVVDNQAQLNPDNVRPDNRITRQTYQVISGDNLWLIARTQLRDDSRWPEIASLNKIDAQYIIQPGQILQLPKV